MVQKLRPVTATWFVDGDGTVEVEETGSRTRYPDEESLDLPGRDRRRIIGAALNDGTSIFVDDGREVSWPCDLAKERDRLSRCESGGKLLWNGEKWLPSPTFCRSRFCPRCARTRVGRFAFRWMPFFTSAIADGAGIYHLTWTQPTRPAAGAVVLPHERKRYVGTSGPGVHGGAVGGESLTGSYQRFRSQLRSAFTDGATRGRWRHAIPGYMYGIEWTLRNGKQRGPQIPRWHCHAHMLVVVPGGWRNAYATYSGLRADWCELADGDPKAQHLQIIRGGDGQTVEQAVLEVMKYPFEPTELTCAGVVEAFASQRGTRPHHVGGALYATSRLHKEQPWARWLAQRRDPPSWPALMFRVERNHPWQVFHGQVREGPCWWGFAGVTFQTWEADAEGYWDVLRAGLGSDEARAGAELADASVGELELGAA